MLSQCLQSSKVLLAFLSLCVYNRSIKLCAERMVFMRVKAIMIPFRELHCIQMDDTVGKAMEVIDQQRMLSLPVIQDKEFVGVLSKQFTYETFFKEWKGTKEEFLAQPVSVFMMERVENVGEDERIEEAAKLFIRSKVRFIPVMDKAGKFVGIVTQQAVFKAYQNMFGHKHNSLVVYTYDYKGVIAKITETIAKAGGDIRNMMMFHTDVMDLVELFMRIDAPDFDKVVKALKKQNFDIRDIKPVEQ